MYAKEHGRRPKVFLAGYGNPAMRTARATFSGDFFGVAGFEILPEGVYPDAITAGKESAKADAEIVVICSSDDDYVAAAADFARAFKAAAPGKTLVVAGYPADVVEDLKAAGVDDFIHVKVNALEALKGYQEKLGIKID